MTHDHARRQLLKFLAASSLLSPLAGMQAVALQDQAVDALITAPGQALDVFIYILRRELRMVMRQAGTVRISDITRSYVIDRRPAVS